MSITNNSEVSQGKCCCFVTIARERTCTSYKMALKNIFNKLNQHNHHFFGKLGLLRASWDLTYDKGCIGYFPKKFKKMIKPGKCLGN